jgi:signal transduction histidine kinase
MENNFTAGITIRLIPAVLSLILIIILLLKGKKSGLLYSYITFQSLIFIALVYELLYRLFLELHFFNLSWLIGAQLQYLTICFLGYSWLVFCLFYAGAGLGTRVHRWKAALLSLPPLVCYIAALTDKYHHLFWGYNGQGFFFIANLLISYTFFITGTILILRYSFRQYGVKRKQSLLLVFAISIPVILNILQYYHLPFFHMAFLDRFVRWMKNYFYISPHFTMTPIGFFVTMLIITLATFKYRFLNITPIALRKVVDNVKEAIIVLDNYNHIIDSNNAFFSTFLDYLSSDAEDLRSFSDKMSQGLEEGEESCVSLQAIQSETVTNFNGELSMVKPKRKCFSVSIRPVLNKRNEVLGRVVSFNDISGYKNLLHELNRKNGELSSANEQLKQYASTVEELTVIKERNRVARDVHDTLGHAMTMLIALLEVSAITCRKDPEKTEEKLTEAIRVAREGLKEVRRSISGLAPEKLAFNELIPALKKMFLDFQISGTEIDFSVDGIQMPLTSQCSDTIYRVCQEALTNSVRHGNATSVSIILRYTLEYIKLYILDNGCGTKNIKKGFGLSGMEQRVSEAAGSIVYGSDGESGFNIRVEIPVSGNVRLSNIKQDA